MDTPLGAIFFIGPQGSGKGTQAKILAERLGFFYWEMGGIIRGVAAENTELGQEAKALHDAGVLFPDELLLKVFKYKMNIIPKNQGVIFDGVPRRIGQAEFILHFLKEQGRSNVVTILINIPHDESIDRLLLRAEKEARKDDTREAIEFRLKQYEQDTLPMLDYLKKETKFIEIDGKPPVEAVTKSINKALGLHD